MRAGLEVEWLGTDIKRQGAGQKKVKQNREVAEREDFGYGPQEGNFLPYC